MEAVNETIIQLSKNDTLHLHQFTFLNFRIVTSFYLFITGKHAEYDETKIVQKLKIAESGFESAPQAVMQLYFAFVLSVEEQGDLIKGKQKYVSNKLV